RRRDTFVKRLRPQRFYISFIAGNWRNSCEDGLIRSRMVQKLKSRGLTIVIVEHSAKPLVLSYRAVRRDRLHWNNETVVEPLMVTVQMIMRHKLANRIPQRVFTKEDHLPQAILPNRSDEPFRISSQIRRLRWQFDGLDSDRGKRSEKLSRVKWISIVDQ